MKDLKIALAILGVAHGILAIEAKAADPYEPLPEPAYEAPNYAFTGLAVGVDGGGQFTAIDIDTGGFSFDGISADGLIGGAHVEYLFAVDRFRFGAYGEGGFSNVNTELTVPFGPGFSGDLLHQDHYYGFGLKAGVTIFGDSIAYARGGYDWSQWSSDAVDGEADVGAWLIGGGIETMVSKNVSLGLGVDYLMLNDIGIDGHDALADAVTDALGDSEAIRVKARLTWRN